MTRINKKLIAKILLCLASFWMIIGSIVYILKSSEPTYIDNLDNREVQKWDYVIDKYGNEGVVVQVDILWFSYIVKDNYGANHIKTLLKNENKWTHSYSDDDQSYGDKGYKIIGKGTWFHKMRATIGSWTEFILVLFNIIMVFSLAPIIITNVWDIYRHLLSLDNF